MQNIMKNAGPSKVLAVFLGLAAPLSPSQVVAQSSFWVTLSGDGTVLKVDLQDGFKKTTKATGLNMSWGCDFDPHGNFCVSDTGHGDILRIQPDGSRSTIATGLSSPSGLAIDKGDPYQLLDLFVAEYGSGCFQERKYIQVDQHTWIKVGCGFDGPVSVREAAASRIRRELDRLDLLLTYRGGSPGGVVLVSRAPDGTWTHRQTVASDLSYAYDAITDQSGNLFVSEAGRGRILKYPAAADGLFSTNPVVFVSGFSPVGLAFDYEGSLYAADYGGTIKRFLFRNGTLGTNAVSIVTGLNALSYLAFPPPPIARIRRAGSNIVLAWPDALYNLQAGTAVTGPFTNLPAATSPFTNAAGGRAQFFRLGSK